MKQILNTYMNILGPGIGLLLVFVIFGILEGEQFLTLYNFKTVAAQSVIVALGALGMTLVMISGGIDLSIGSNIAFTTVVTAICLRSDFPPGISICIGVGAAILVGMANAALITRLRIVPFIATLGMLEVVRGLAQWLGAEQKINAPVTWIGEIMTKFPTPGWVVFAWGVWILLISMIFMMWFLKYTILGRHTFAIGSNENAARLCGININRVKFKVYALAGLFAGLAGIAQFSRLGVGDPTVAVGKELDIVAAVVIGGGSLSGGKGSILGSVTGALLMAFLRNGCTLVGISSPAQRMVIGTIIILAVALDKWRSASEA